MKRENKFFLLSGIALVAFVLLFWFYPHSCPAYLYKPIELTLLLVPFPIAILLYGSKLFTRTGLIKCFKIFISSIVGGFLAFLLMWLIAVVVPALSGRSLLCASLVSVCVPGGFYIGAYLGYRMIVRRKRT